MISFRAARFHFSEFTRVVRMKMRGYRVKPRLPKCSSNTYEYETVPFFVFFFTIGIGIRRRWTLAVDYRVRALGCDYRPRIRRLFVVPALVLGPQRADGMRIRLDGERSRTRANTYE